jgi:hypothetical protein
MATENQLKCLSMLAAADLSTKQFYLVKVSAASTVNLAGNGEAAIGVLQDKPAAAARACTVGYEGVTKCVAGAPVAAGSFVSADAAGKAVNPASGEQIVGVAVTAAAGANEVFEVLLKNFGPAA